MRTPCRPRPALIAATLAVVIGTLCLPPVDAEGFDLSRQSELSAMASVEVPVAVLGALSEGGAFVIESLVVSGAVVVVTVAAVGVAGASFAVTLAIGTAHALGLAAGVALEVVSVGGGWLLRAAGEPLCFIADADTRAHLRSREL